MYAFASLPNPAVGRKNKNTSVFQTLTVVTGGYAPGFETTNKETFEQCAILFQ